MKKVVLLIIAGLVLLFIGFFLVGIYLTNGLIDDRTDNIIETAQSETTGMYYHEQVKMLPQPVQNYFEFALQDSIAKPRLIRLKQEGKFKTNIGAEFKEISAEQFSLISQPAFIWNGKIDLGSFIWVHGIDTYSGGRGDLIIKFMSGITISKESGDETAQAQVVRWVMEFPWYPAAFLPSENLSWSGVDSSSAKLTYTHNKIEIDAVVHFNQDGSIDKIETERYMSTTAGPQLTDYTGYYSNYKEVDGMMIPHHGEVEWNLDHQDLKYYIFDITDIEFDVFKKFED